MPLLEGARPTRRSTIAEAMGRSDDYGWRSIYSGGSSSDVNASIRDRGSRQAVNMAMKNMLAKRLIKLRINYVIGQGLSVVSEKPEHAIAIMRWWTDPYNQWKKRFGPRLWDFYVKGEMIQRPFTDPVGFTRIGDVDINAISGVIMDPYDDGVVDKVTFFEMREGANVQKNVSVPVIRRRLDPDTKALDNELTGDVFFHTLNRSSTQTRGSSDLLSLLDYLDSLDKVLYARADMIRALSSVYFDLQIEGMSEEGMRSYAQQHRSLPPKPGTVWAHSPTMEMKPVTPDFRSNDMEKELRLFQSLIVGSDGWPGMLFDDPGGAGRAVGSEMMDSAMRNVTALQAEIEPILMEEMDYYLEKLGLRTIDRKSGMSTYRIVWDKPSIREIARFAPAVERIAKSMALAEQNRWLTQAEQRSIMVQQIKSLGLSDMPIQIELPAELIEEEPEPELMMVPGQQQNGTRALPVQNPNNGRSPNGGRSVRVGGPGRGQRATQQQRP